MEHHPMGPRGGMHNRLEHLTKMLDLTEAQQQQVKAVFEASAVQRKAIMDEPLSQADRDAKVKALMEDSQTKVRAVLTPDQQQKFDSMQKMHRQHWQHNGSKSGAQSEHVPPAAGEPGAPAGSP